MESNNKNEKYDEIISRFSDDQTNEDSNVGIRAQDEYHYFNFKSIESSLYIDAQTRMEGKRLIKNEKIELAHVSNGYVQTEFYDYEPVSKFVFISKEKSIYSQKIKVELIISQDEILSAKCSCDNCDGYYYWMSNNKACKYKSAAKDLAIEYLKNNNTIDSTDAAGQQLINDFAGKVRSQIISQSRQLDESLKIEPRIIMKDNELQIDFKVGSTKMFKISDLIHFVELVRSSESEKYGTNTMINHGIQNFTEESRRWVNFIQDSVDEEMRIREGVAESTWSSVKKKKMGCVPLYGWKIDQMYKLIDGNPVKYENRDIKKRTMMTVKQKNPSIKIHIEPVSIDDVFQGIYVIIKSDQIFFGTETAYYIDADEGYLCRITDEYYKQMEPVLRQAKFGGAEFEIGRNNLQEFYYNVLPMLDEYADVTEKNSKQIEQYLLPETRFAFYLDAQDNDVDCKVTAKYGDNEYSCFDILKKRTSELEKCRVKIKEQEIMYRLENLFPVKDIENERFCCGTDEEKVFDIISGGVDELAKYGDVYCTKRFKNINSSKKPKLNLGISVSGGMLELDVLTEDLSNEELLELLKNYKKHSRYYRFKSGEFIEIGDSSLQMLFEMMEAMHMTPKEFVKGKMHLPLYRTLYLDKMLEEHSEVYNTRDQQFRQIVKNMKAANDSDFEVPASLDKTMRNYQKNGFRWMKTLESCNFCGILADDMGLGKTLQTIALLLAAKEEGKKGTSIVIAPASLVYNWREEFTKFAAGLNVYTLAGKADEREELIKDYSNADVLITSYDVLKRDIDQYENCEFIYEVIDEAQYIKNQTTAAAKAVKLINSKNRLALTGTPIENRLSELWSIFDYLMPGFLYSYDVFRREYETQIVKYEDKDMTQRLQKMVKPFILRRLKTDVLKDLPDKLEETRVVKFDGEQQKLYDAQVVHMKEEIAKNSEEDFNKNKLKILAELTRIRQICCDPHLCFENYNGQSAKLESCLELIDSAIEADHKILLFSQFTSMLKIIEERLLEKGIRFYKITGATSKKDRIGMVKQFNDDDTPVFLISLKAGGVGLNLTGADMVIHYDPWWNVAVQNQATDRAHRIGQTKKVTVYKMIAKGTIEEKIVKLQETKKDLADSIISGENVGISNLSKEDLMELLGI